MSYPGIPACACLQTVHVRDADCDWRELYVCVLIADCVCRRSTRAVRLRVVPASVAVGRYAAVIRCVCAENYRPGRGSEVRRGGGVGGGAKSGGQTRADGVTVTLNQCCSGVNDRGKNGRLTSVHSG